MRRVLFICYGGGHVASVYPVISQLNKTKGLTVQVLALTTAYQYLQERGIQPLQYKDFANLYSLTDWKELGAKILGSEKDYQGVVDYEESLAYHGINFVDLVQAYGKNKAEEIYAKKGRHCFYPINFLKKVVERLSPDIVLATNSPRSERAALQAAKDLGVPSVCLVDLFALQEYQWIAKDDFCDYVLVLNSAVKEFLVLKGRNEQHIFVTGNPAFDSIWSDKTVDGAIALRDKYDCKKINILYSSQPEPSIHPFTTRHGDVDLPNKVEEVLRKFVAENEAYRLVLRFHPSEQKYFKPQKDVIQSDSNESLHSMLHCMDIVIVTASTVGLEAYLAGKPVLSVDRSIFTADAPFSKMGISDGVSHEEELPDRILCSSVTDTSSSVNSSKNLATKNVSSFLMALLDK